MGHGRNRGALAAGCALTLLLTVAPAPVSASRSVADARSVASKAFPGENGRIAFVSDRNGQFDIYAMDPDGGNVTRLTNTPDREDFPVWSPGGTRLAFAAGPFDEQNIFVMKADGSGVTQLTDAPGRDYEPAWSPDGTKILFASDRGRAAGSSQVYVMNADGSGETLLGSAPVGGTARSPIWSPEGDRIAYVFNDSGTVGDTMFVAAPDGSGRTVVPGMAESLEELELELDGLGELDWSPDGSRIVFVGSDSGSADLFDVELESGEVTQLTEKGNAGAPAWSPDGQLITFTVSNFNSGESAVVDDISVMNADGTGEVPLTFPDDFMDTQPTWQVTHEPAAALTVTPGSAQREVGEEHAVRFTPTDATGVPIAGQDLIVQVTGAHPQTATITSLGDGRATFTWVGSGPGTDTVNACADSNGSGACDLLEPRVTATVLWGTIDEGDEPRLAFTDDSDALYAVDVDRVVASGGAETYSIPDPPTSFATNLAGYEAGPKHEGEAGGTPNQAPAFVSTRDDPNGEVYVASGVGPGSGATRVTCDPGTETHPVRNTDGTVAFASDADGDWDIYVSVPPPVIINRAAAAARTPRVAASGPAAGPPGDVVTCDAGWTTINVTNAAPDTDELWPTWTYTRENTDTGVTLTPSGLVYSRSSDGQPARPLHGRRCRRVLEPSARAHEHSGLRRDPAGGDDVRDRRSRRQPRAARLPDLGGVHDDPVPARGNHCPPLPGGAGRRGERPETQRRAGVRPRLVAHGQSGPSGLHHHPGRPVRIDRDSPARGCRVRGRERRPERARGGRLRHPQRRLLRDRREPPVLGQAVRHRGGREARLHEPFARRGGSGLQEPGRGHQRRARPRRQPAAGDPASGGRRGGHGRAPV